MNKNFIWNENSEIVYKEIETQEGKTRFYLTPDGKYPSITSVLSVNKSDGIQKWVDRVGKETAEVIKMRSANIGTTVHELTEDYLKNKLSNMVLMKQMPDRRFMFLKFRDTLNRIDNIHHLEIPLYSNILKVAGRCDCIAEFDGKLSIIDFKTSKSEKKEEWIENYFLQTTFYAMCVYEMFGVEIRDIVILITCRDGTQQVFQDKVCNWMKKLDKTIKKWYNQ